MHLFFSDVTDMKGDSLLFIRMQRARRTVMQIREKEKREREWRGGLQRGEERRSEGARKRWKEEAEAR